MKEKTKLLPKNRKLLEQAKSEAHERVVKRGIVQFRADDQLMDILLKIADYKRIPLGVLVRSWVMDRVREEAIILPLPVITLPGGKTLTQQSSLQEIEKAIFDYQNGKVRLTKEQHRTLSDWLLDKHHKDKYANRESAF